ncbi:hypothetical protein M885DRAFT_615064 [Pelagophyceae sp. CCMP2097]|nr:hypothetical protein M885DRAFT_615064 [Pelagophyceae sp. CCMP2097]
MDFLSGGSETDRQIAEQLNAPRAPPFQQPTMMQPPNMMMPPQQFQQQPQQMYAQQQYYAPQQPQMYQQPQFQQPQFQPPPQMFQPPPQAPPQPWDAQPWDVPQPGAAYPAPVFPPAPVYQAPAPVYQAPAPAAYAPPAQQFSDPRLAAYAPAPPAQDEYDFFGFGASSSAAAPAPLAQPPLQFGDALGDALDGFDMGFSDMGFSETPAAGGSAAPVGARAPADDGDEDEPEVRLELTIGEQEQFSVVFESEVKLGMLLERRQKWAAKAGAAKTDGKPPEQTIVTMVIEGGAAARKGVDIGSRLLGINGRDATLMPYAEALDLVKTLPRPLTLLFERSRAACDTAKGWCLVYKSMGGSAPGGLSAWKRMYFVMGGVVAKRHVLQLYQTKAQYEDIVVRMFQGETVSGMKYKAYALSPAFKCSSVQSKQYSAQTVKFFALRNPYSRTKTMKFGSENPSVIHALHSHVTKFSSDGI